MSRKSRRPGRWLTMLGNMQVALVAILFCQALPPLWKYSAHNIYTPAVFDTNLERSELSSPWEAFQVPLERTGLVGPEDQEPRGGSPRTTSVFGAGWRPQRSKSQGEAHPHTPTRTHTHTHTHKICTPKQGFGGSRVPRPLDHQETPRSTRTPLGDHRETTTTPNQHTTTTPPETRQEITETTGRHQETGRRPA